MVLTVTSSDRDRREDINDNETAVKVERQMKFYLLHATIAGCRSTYIARVIGLFTRINACKATQEYRT
jgi:hypothetical protein